MSQQNERRTAKTASLDAARTLYFVVAALSVREALIFAAGAGWPTTVASGWAWLITFGFLVTLFRYSHGVAIVYELEKTAAAESRAPTLIRTELIFVAFSTEALAFFLMARNLGQPFAVTWCVVLLLIADMGYILTSKAIRAASAIGILTSISLWPRLRTTTPGTSARTHVIWALSDLALGTVLLLMLLDRPAFTASWLTADYALDWQMSLAVALLLTAVADYGWNRRFYFGGKRAARTKKLVYVCDGTKDADCRVRTREDAVRVLWYCKSLYSQPSIVPFSPDLFYSRFLVNEGLEGAARRISSLEFLKQCDAIHFLHHGETNHESLELNTAKAFGLEIKWVEQPAPTSTFSPIWKEHLPHPTPNSLDGNAERHRVFVCSRLRGDATTPDERQRNITENIALANWLCHRLVFEQLDDKLWMAPIAPQAFYPHVTNLAESKDDEWLEKAIEILKTCDTMLVFNKTGFDQGVGDISVSSGMRKCIDVADELGIRVRYCPIPAEWENEKADWLDQDLSERKPVAQESIESPVVYFAGPLFTSAERVWNSGLAGALRAEGFAVRLPQEDAAALITDGGFDPRAIFELASRSVSTSNVVLAVLDGADVDSGTAFECGVAWKVGVPIVGIRSDLRKGGDDAEAGVNLMLSGACRSIVSIDAFKELAPAQQAGRIATVLRDTLNMPSKG